MEGMMKEFEAGRMLVAVLSNRIVIGTEYYESTISIRDADIDSLMEALKQAKEHISKKQAERYDRQDKKVAEAWKRREEETMKGKEAGET